MSELKNIISRYTESEESDPFETDDTSDYFPLSCSSSSGETESKRGIISGHVTPKQCRKRVRNVSEWRKYKRQRLRRQGKEYETAKGKKIRAKQLQPYEHKCRYDCNLISDEQRQILFTKFYELPSYDVQTQYLASCISKNETKRYKAQATHHNHFYVVVKLLGLRVCKEFFLKTFDITNKRYRTVCLKKDSEGFTQCDKRGRHTPANKIDDNKRNSVLEHINKFPRYKSHYSRSQNLYTQYLPEDLNVCKMYTLYTEWCAQSQKEPVKESYYRHIFSTKFNLKFHKPHSDTCHTCDRLTNLIKNDTQSQNQNQTEHELHLEKVECVKNQKKLAIEYGTQNPAKARVICFDLQKTLPTPVVTTSKAYYLRQLWTYNFCIHDMVSGISHMYIWNETIAHRGSQEIGSCILKYVKGLPDTVTNLICFSDQCGGQNKNKNIAKLFMYLVQSTKLEKIDHIFFEIGHSYMDCDRSFARIEKAKNSLLSVFVPEDWTRVIKKTSKKFTVYEMKQTDFVSFDYLNSILIDPKKDAEKGPIKWREIVRLQYKKDNFFYFCYSLVRNFDAPVNQSEKCSALKVGRPSFLLNEDVFKPLHPTPLKIPYLKWENLTQLLPYIPPVHHDFYMNIPHETNIKNSQTKSQTKKEDENAELDEAHDSLLSDYDN